MQPPSPPVPIQATFTLATSTLVVDFDKLLETSFLVGSNWFAWTGVDRRSTPVGTGFAFLRRVTIALPTVVPDFSAQRCTYTAVVPDVIGRNGLPVLPFIAFPLTVI